MPTNPSGRFSDVISAQQLMKGLPHHLYATRGTDVLVQSDYAVGYEDALATVPDLAERQIVLDWLGAEWPFPQVFQCHRRIFVCTQDRIAIAPDSEDELKVAWQGGLNHSPWNLMDFMDSVVLSNGETCLLWDYETDSITAESRCPPFRACLNYNQQAIIGGPLVQGVM